MADADVDALNASLLGGSSSFTMQLEDRLAKVSFME